MRGTLRFAYLLAVGVWVGAVVCFSFVVAPAAFRTFDTAQAGDIVGAVLGPYYRLGRAVGVISIVGALLLARRAVAPGRWRAAAVAHVLGFVATIWAGSFVFPETQHLRAMLHDQGAAPASSADFNRLHRRAVGLNGVTLVSALVGLGCAAAALRE